MDCPQKPLLSQRQVTAVAEKGSFFCHSLAHLIFLVFGPQSIIKHPESNR